MLKSFDEYVQQAPAELKAKAEHSRNWLGDDAMFIKCDDEFAGTFVGGYLRVHTPYEHEPFVKTRKNKPLPPQTWWILVGDRDDTAVRHMFNSKAEMLEGLKELELLEPCGMDDLTLFGYNWD